MTYRDRREARADRLDGWAEKRETKSTEAFQKADAITSQIPFGQPILVGHHSEGRHRRDLGRAHANMDAAVAHSRKAEEMTGKAANIRDALDRSIYSDDPHAIEQLEARIEVLEAERDRVKQYNASCRKGAPDLSILTEAERTEIADIARVAAWQSKGGAFPTYHLSNLSANIKRNRDRLEMLKRDRARAGRAEANAAANPGAPTIEHLSGGSTGYVAITFPEKPAREIIEALKAAGFHWRRGSWWGKADAVPAEVAASVA